ncbi:hypothetical protein FOA52_003739 [Chlamydomonas sp. UWO 241]|nr:hypothetical protein FOA52_003739 [Chlamydomonas sp. UWO 241]
MEGPEELLARKGLEMEERLEVVRARMSKLRERHVKRELWRCRARGRGPGLPIRREQVLASDPVKMPVEAQLCRHIVEQLLDPATLLPVSADALHAQLLRGPAAPQYEATLQALGVRSPHPLLCKLSVPPMSLCDLLQLDNPQGGAPLLWVVGMARQELARIAGVEDRGVAAAARRAQAQELAAAARRRLREGAAAGAAGAGQLQASRPQQQGLGALVGQALPLPLPPGMPGGASSLTPPPALERGMAMDTMMAAMPPVMHPQGMGNGGHMQMPPPPMQMPPPPMQMHMMPGGLPPPPGQMLPPLMGQMMPPMGGMMPGAPHGHGPPPPGWSPEPPPHLLPPPGHGGGHMPGLVMPAVGPGGGPGGALPPHVMPWPPQR